MAKKFGYINPVRIPPGIAQGTKDKELVEAINLAFDQIVTQTNDVLQRATRILNEALPFWGRGEIVEVVQGKAEAIAGVTAFYQVRHHLGVVPSEAIMLLPTLDVASTMPTSTAFSIVRDVTGDFPWTDTHVYFRVTSVTTSAFRRRFLLIP